MKYLIVFKGGIVVHKYPKKIYCSVLLLDGKIVDYKIGHSYWFDKGLVTLRGQISFEEYQRAEVKYTSWTVYNDTQSEEVFNGLAQEWMEQYK